MTSIKISNTVSNSLTSNQIENITSKLLELVNNNDLENLATSITFDSDGFDKIYEITL